jgi:hypothetical protein
VVAVVAVVADAHQLGHRLDGRADAASDPAGLGGRGGAAGAAAGAAGASAAAAAALRRLFAVEIGCAAAACRCAIARFSRSQRARMRDTWSSVRRVS